MISFTSSSVSILRGDRLLRFSQRLTGKAKNERAASTESDSYDRVESCKGTLKEFGLVTPVRLSSKTKTPTGSQISVVTAVADIDYRIDADGGITLVNAKLSRCDGNLASERTGESWRGDSLTPSALLAAANEDLQLEGSNLVRCIIGNASRKKSSPKTSSSSHSTATPNSSSPMRYVWAALALPIASIASLLCLAVGVMLCFGPYWIAGLVMLFLALASLGFAVKAFRVFKPEKQ